MALYALLSFVSAQVRNHLRRRTKFDDLPAEVVVLISESCSMYSAVALAHTCKSMHHHLRATYLRKWANLSSHERIDFLWELWWRWPLLDNYVCASCCKLHYINDRDVPSEPHPGLSKGCIGSTACSSYKWQYRLQQHHIALALQYSRTHYRMGSDHKRYLNSILAPYTNDSLYTNKSCVRFEAWPAVLDSTFVLNTRWTFSFSPTVSPLAGFRKPFRLCPHQYYTRDSAARARCTRNNALPVAIDDALRKVSILPNNGKHFSCSYCATDFWVRAGCNQLEVRVWQSLGITGHPSDQPWIVHTGEMGESIVRHKPGAVRKLVVDAKRSWENRRLSSDLLSSLCSKTMEHGDR